MAENENEQADAAPIPQPPSQEETQSAINKIDDLDNKNAANALKELATSIVKCVVAIDRAHNVSEYVDRIEVVCKDIGSMELRIYEKDGVHVNSDEIAREASEELKQAGEGYGKELRPVQLNFDTGGARNGSAHSEGSD